MTSTGGCAPGSYGKSKKIVAQKAVLSLEICRCKSGKNTRSVQRRATPKTLPQPASTE
jgi:hypothetical protein